MNSEPQTARKKAENLHARPRRTLQLAAPLLPLPMDPLDNLTLLLCTCNSPGISRIIHRLGIHQLDNLGEGEGEPLPMDLLHNLGEGEGVVEAEVE